MQQEAAIYKCDAAVRNLGEKEFERFDDLIYHHYTNRVPIGRDNVVLLTPISHSKTLFKSDDIEILSELGEGNFGKVYKVRIKSQNIQCAMKTMHENVPREMKEMFVKEMDMMATMHHENIVTCIGTVESNSEIKILLELINQGSLESLVQRNKLTDRGKARLLYHVAKGMSYLHKRNIIHRDLAARNILVNKDESKRIIAKVSDFGLSRRDDSGRGYQLQSSQKLPLRWLAPECFTKRSWTKASDVWSFGILMYEVFTNGAEPYADMNLEDAKNLSKYISKGGHPAEIPGLNPLMREIMLSCWKLREEERPTMEQLQILLLQTYRQYGQNFAKIKSICFETEKSKIKAKSILSFTRSENNLKY
uniref:Protein kinase domain-containing protein n=1 Tax=Romanomermis culicivorax TaxID=13658 RepID=A0A915ISL9_ROMCU